MPRGRRQSPKPNPIKAYATLRGEYLRDVAEAVGIKPITLSLVARGDTKAWPGLRRRLAEHFDVPECVLFPEAVPTPPIDFIDPDEAVS
jgi:transcriptional regulator with XRE-family HTH domain